MKYTQSTPAFFLGSLASHVLPPGAILAVSLLLVGVVPGATAAVTVTAPSAVDSVAGALDYATQTFQDPWDMRQLTDFGWFLYSADSPASSLSNISFNGGIFSATTTSTESLLFLLDSPIPGTAPIGKTGANFPIDADEYTVLAFRMSVGASSAAQLFWSKVNMFTDAVNGGDVTCAGNIPVSPGWRVYVVKIPTLTRFYGVGTGSYPWAGLMRMLRFDPTIVSGDTVQLNWMRLVNDDATQYRTISWSGASPVDIYLDNDSLAANGNLGAVATGVSASSYSFYVGALPAGDYWVAVVPAGANPATGASYSTGHYHVDGTPTIAFTAPSEEGSADDFATAQLGDPWEMDSLVDIDHYEGVSSLFTGSVAAQNEAGASLGYVGVIQGVSSPALAGSVGDPRLWPLFWMNRGATKRIDPDRYRILTLEWGVPGARDLVNGSIARVIWRVAGELVENVSDDIVVNSKAGSSVTIDKVITDMKTLPLETDPGGSPSTTGWSKGTSANPGIDGFRVDPHEFSNPTDFYIKRVKLAALESMGNTYQVGWTYTPAGSATTLSLYYDQTGQGFAGTQIVAGLDPANVDATHGAYVWDTSSLTSGNYYVYATVMRGGSVINRAYARWPVVKVAVTAPVVNGVGPAAGSTDGGTPVTVSGAGFQAGAVVRVGGVLATGVVVAGAGTITATTPAHAAGVVDVVVTNPDAQSGTLAGGFTYASVGPAMSVSRSALYFGATNGGAITTSGQAVTVSFAGGAAVAWTATSNNGFIRVLSGSGTGTGTFTVTIASGSYSAPSTLSGSVTVSAPGASNTPQAVAVTLKVYSTGATAAPFGHIDSPADGASGIVGAVPFTGWVLDDVDVQKVELWRDKVGTEAVGTNGLVYIGVATLVSGQRPDVEATYPTYPFAYRAAWGYSILTNLLPNGGNGTYKLYAYAADVDGHQVLLGARTFTATNATATKPFGTIDTPAQGTTISGAGYVSWGWALAPQPNLIPLDGSTITVYIDGVAVGHPSYGYSRPDIDTLFPGLQNSGQGVGYSVIDTTKLTNGVHTIVWGVTDNHGNAEGLGSRYFWVAN